MSVDACELNNIIVAWINIVKLNEYRAGMDF